MVKVNCSRQLLASIPSPRASIGKVLAAFVSWLCVLVFAAYVAVTRSSAA
jgi:hypothetical protein